MKNNLLAGAAMQSTKRIMAAMLCATMFLAGCSTDTEAENPLPESSSEVEQQSEQVDIEEEKRTEVETAIALTEAIYGVDAEGLLNLMQQDALNYAITKSYTTRAAFAQELGEMLTYIADLQATEMDIKDGESIMMGFSTHMDLL